jgi:hypothetical protein
VHRGPVGAMSKYIRIAVIVLATVLSAAGYAAAKGSVMAVAATAVVMVAPISVAAADVR